MTLFGPLVNALLAHERGDPLEQRRAQGAPPHLQQRQWKFICACGYGWRTNPTEPLDAVVKAGRWVPPEQPCVGCHQWVPGRPIEG